MDAKPISTTMSMTVCGSLCLCESGLHALVWRHVGRSTTLCYAMGYGLRCDLRCVHVIWLMRTVEGGTLSSTYHDVNVV